MRIDKFLTESGVCSRSEAQKSAKKGLIEVNGIKIKDTSVHIDPTKDKVSLDGKEIVYEEFVYIMLNKPAGYVCSTDDPEKTVLELLPEEYSKKGLFPCGRLDKNTLGFVLMTNNGKLAHFLLSPKEHVEKTYKFELKDPISDEEIAKIENGVTIKSIKGEFDTLPCKIRRDAENSGYITLREGKYHEIKLMAESVGNKITYLERISFGGIALDESLERGEYRKLTDDEINVIMKWDRSV